MAEGTAPWICSGYHSGLETEQDSGGPVQERGHNPTTPSCSRAWGVCGGDEVGGEGPGRLARAEGRGAAAVDPHLKLGGDAMCSPRNGEAAGGDAVPPPRPPLSRSAILRHSPGHPDGARRGGSSGRGEGGGSAARAGLWLGRRAGAPAQGWARLRTARRSRGWRERPRARPRVPAGGSCAPPQPRPAGALRGAGVATPRLGPAPP